jgi:hypothetical protein
MQALEMPPIVRQHSAAQSVSAGQNVWVRRTPVSIFLRCHNVVSTLPQFLNYR